MLEAHEIAVQKRIAELKQLRGRVKRKLTSFERALIASESNSEADFELLDLEGRLSAHAPLWDCFEKLQDKLESLAIDDETLNAHEIERTSFENRFFTLNGRARKLNKKQLAQENSNSTNLNSIQASNNSCSHSTQSHNGSISNLMQSNDYNSSPENREGAENNENTESRDKSADQLDINESDNSKSNNSQNTRTTAHIGLFVLDPNLPKLGLPSFSGTFDAWLGFRDIFNSMVHTNNQVPTIFKFHYLKSCVKGEAAEVIASLE